MQNVKYNPNSAIFPNQVVEGRDPELYPKRQPDVPPRFHEKLREGDMKHLYPQLFDEDGNRIPPVSGDNGGNQTTVDSSGAAESGQHVGTTVANGASGSMTSTDTYSLSNAAKINVKAVMAAASTTETEEATTTTTKTTKSTKTKSTSTK